MNRSRTFYAKRNIVFGFLNKLITILLPFAIRTIIIYKLGEEYLGLNGLFTAILQAFNMAEMGFSSAIVFKMYKPMSENDTDKICALLALFKKVYTIIGSVILVVGLLLTPFLPHLIKGSYPQDVNLYVLYLIYLAGTVISYYGVAYKSSLLSVAQRQDIISNVDTVLILFRSIIQIVLLLVLQNYYWYIICTPVFVLLNNLIIAFISRKLYPEYQCRGKLEKAELKEIVTQIKGLAIGKIGQVSRNSFDSIALSAFVGLTAVAIYSNYYYIFSSVGAVLSVIILGITGGVGNSLAIGTKEKNYNDFKKFNYYYAWISGWCTVCLYCLYQPFMRLWVGEELTASTLTMILFCIYFYTTQMGQVRSMYASASGIWWEFRKLQIAEAVANPILNFGLGYCFGMDGIIFATIITVFVFSIIGIGGKTLKYCFGKSPKEYFALSFLYAAVILIACLVSGSVCSLWRPGGVTELIFCGAICLIVPNVIFFVASAANPMHRKFLFDVKNILIRN